MNVRKWFRSLMGAVALLVAAAAAPARADTLLSWDFENPVSAGRISSFAGAPGVSYATGIASQTGGQLAFDVAAGGPAEDFGPGLGFVHITRWWGSTLGMEVYPYVDVTLTRRTLLSDVTFQHHHNHTAGYPNTPSYKAQLEISDGGPFVEVGDPVLLSGATSGTTAVIDLDLTLDPGIYRIRWMPRDLAYSTPYGLNTNTDFFSLNDVSLGGVWVPEWTGPLAPINADGSSVFKAGSTVPVKFALTGASAGIADLAATLSVAKLADSVPGDVNEATSTSAATEGNLFRYDAASDTYVFNWGTRGLSPGRYRLFIDLGDGGIRFVDVALR